MVEPTAAEAAAADVETVVEGIMEATAAVVSTTTTPTTAAQVEIITAPRLEVVAPVTSAAAVTMMPTTTAPTTTKITTQKPLVTTTTLILATETPANTDNCNNNNLEATISTTTTAPQITFTDTDTSTTKYTSSADAQSSLGATPIHAKRPKARPSPYSKPILLSSDRRSRKKKRISWGKPSFHYFEHVADERINVYRMNADQQLQNDANACNAPSAGSGLINANNKAPDAVGGKMNSNVDSMNSRRPNNVAKMDCDKSLDYLPWRPLILIDFTPELPSPGWNSIERSAQAERETYVLGAIDLPGQPSTLDEPDQQPKSSGPSNGTTSTSFSTTSEQATKEGPSIKIIPLDNPEGMFSEFPPMYDTDIVNGVKTDSPQQQQQQQVQNISAPANAFCSQQQSQLLPNQFQQQLVHTNQNPFTFQDMGVQFQQQAQMQIQFPFQLQQPRQSVQSSFQQPIMPFANQQQQLQAQQHQLQQQQQQTANFVDQQSAGLTGPAMPWLSYPFNQVDENSHAHLFRRPAT